ncbi:MAG TPA: recombinase family protein [Trebonia sp.]
MAERAGRWLRVSTKGDQSEANQEPDIDEWIASHGYELADGCTYRLQKSAYKGKHAATLDKVITDMQDKRFTVLVVWHSSRIERRGAYSVFDLARRVLQAGGRIEYVKEPHLNVVNDMSDAMLAISATANNLESKNKSKFVRIGQDATRKNKGVVSRLVYGYRAEGERRAKRPVIYEPEAAIVREAVRRYLAGESLRDIAEDFNHRGVPKLTPNGKRWYVGTLGNLIRNPAIAGRQMTGWDKPGAEPQTILEYEPIITWQDHELVNARMNARAYRKGISPFNVYLLTGVLFDEAGHPMYGKTDGYVSAKYVCRQGCGHGVRVADADADVSQRAMDTWGQGPRMVRQLVPGENYSDQIARRRQDIRELDPEAEPDTPDGIRRAELLAEIKHLRSLPAKRDHVEWVPVRNPDGTIETAAQHWDKLDTAGRRDWLKERGAEVTARKLAGRWVFDAQWHQPITWGGSQGTDLTASMIAARTRVLWRESKENSLETRKAPTY